MTDYKTEILAEAIKVSPTRDPLEFLAEKYSEAMNLLKLSLQFTIQEALQSEINLHNATHIQIPD